MHILTAEFRRFASRHDDIPAFHAAVIAITVIAAALFNIGAFLLLIIAHASLDIVKYRDVHRMRWGKTLYATFREGLLDLAFLALALSFALYLHHGQSVFALSSAVRIEEVLIRFVGMGIARLEVLVHGIWVFSNLRQHLLDLRVGNGPWKRRETLFLLVLLSSIIFIVSSPLFMDTGAIGKVFSEQLIPWRL